MRRLSERWRVPAACAFVLAVWTVIAFVVFSPQMPCGDCGVKYVQTQGLIASRFRSMTLPYPGAGIDATGAYFPLIPPYALKTDHGMQSIWSPTVVLLQAPFAMAGGLAGIVLMSLASGVVILRLSARLAGTSDDWIVPLAIGLGTCLWYYAIEPWEHAPAVACAMGALAIASMDRRRSAVIAGLLIGAAAVLRYELLLLVPTVWLMLWSRRRRVAALVAAGAATAAVLIAIGILDASVYGRPPAVHLLQQVGAVRWLFRVLGLTGEVQRVAAFSTTERYDTVVHYWLTSSLSRGAVLGSAAALALSAALVRWSRSLWSVLATVLVLAGWAGWELWQVTIGPKSIPAMFTLSPFLVLALVPATELDDTTRRRRRLLVAGSAIAVLAAILTTDTAGGKAVGPRMLLGIVPLLSIGACQAIVSYLRAPRERVIARLIGWTGVALIVMSIGINVSPLRAYADRNHSDLEALTAVRRIPEQIVVVDDASTVGMLTPIYFEKTLFLVGTRPEAKALAALMVKAGVPGAVTVSLNPQPRISLAPYHLDDIETRGRLLILHWGHPPPDSTAGRR